MNIKKGEAGYLSSKKKRAILKTVLEFGIVAALILLGYQQTGDKMNMLTLVAILGCLPASKALVEVIMVVPHHSIDPEVAKEIAEKTEMLTTAYDLVLTSERHIMPIEAVVISDNIICAYAPSPKVDQNFTIKHIRQMIGNNHLGNVAVKIFNNYNAFITKVSALQNNAEVEKTDTKEKEEKIKRVLLNISL